MDSYVLSQAERDTYLRYSELALPRHTSYPIAPMWREEFGPTQYREELREAAGRNTPYSVYVHVPFCESLCYYCACTKEIVPASKRERDDPSDEFLAALQRELERVGECVGSSPVGQLHLGGGSPTFLSPDHLIRLWDALESTFTILDDAEVAVEVDPRITSFDHLQVLRTLGCNRISLGIQDFSPTTQQAVNRGQPFERVQEFVGECRSLSFRSVNFDLIYGLPYQTVKSMRETLDQTLSLEPDRVAFYRLAVIPEMFRWQNAFRRADLPSGELSLELNLLAINTFLEAGYEFIGLDHFAKPEEPLAQALRDGSIRRNFQGMTTGSEMEILGFGPSTISQFDSAIAQNQKTTAAWQHALDTDLATACGLRLSDEDRLRRELLQQLYGYGTIDKRELEDSFSIRFDEHFADELNRLRTLVQEGVVEVNEDSVRLTTPLGRLLVRVVAAVFDAYLEPDAYRSGVTNVKASKVG